ncbi:capn5 [Cordylochernes scorpioides]|uniref:Capn5 n=1 Tax=Cordylochernes scorpioides TaxID=51811 RepID=A0ABY6KAN1_9ARAC|nr:capn5 [Cordylochernes scorpioides]
MLIVCTQELCDDPHLFVDGACSCDVVQGTLGNCWFVAACSALAQEKVLWNKVIPDHKDQDWSTEDPKRYAGIFCFRFYRFGKWVEVVVDDRLPTIANQLLFLKSRDKNEFWGALLEKAYAKLAGSYEALDGGNLHDALVDFTGGVSETFELREVCKEEEQKSELFRIMKKEMDRHSLMCAAIAAASREEMEAQTEIGLVKGHAYGITAVRRVPLGESPFLLSLFSNREMIPMVRLRNPWGDKEWCGRFSDTSKEWEQVSQTEKDKLGLTFDEDGEFWMLFEDFCIFFTDLSICRLVNTSVMSFSKTWCEAIFPGEWSQVTNRAGGCINQPATALNNPQNSSTVPSLTPRQQYRFDITGDKDDVTMICLMQEDCRSQKKEGRKNLIIGFTIYKVELNRKYRLHRLQERVKSSDFVAARSVFLRTSLAPGRYVVVPCTFTPGEEGRFLLRIYTDTNPEARELTEDTPAPSIWPCIHYPCLVSRVTVLSASGLQKQDTFGSADPYCVVKCEGKRVRTRVLCNTLDPTWGQSFLFYRTSSTSPIKFQVTLNDI